MEITRGNFSARRRRAAKSFTTKVKIIRTRVAGQKIDPKAPRDFTAIALWDTGAERTCLSKEFIKKYSIQKTNFGKSRLAGSAKGNYKTYSYIVDLILNDEIHIKNLVVHDFKSNHKIDILIGMDILVMGDLSIKHFDNETELSFVIH